MTHYVPPVKLLVSVFLALIVLTATTIGVSYIDLGDWNIVAAITIAVIKASLVAWIFMNVRHSTTLMKLFVVAGLIWLGIMMVFTFADYTTRAWTYHPKPW